MMLKTQETQRMACKGLFGKRAVLCLFGDSMTQLAMGEDGWGSRLAHHYSRKADIINRGYGRYNTTWALKVMHSLFPLHSIPSSETIVDDNDGKYFLVTVWFGANDAAIDQNCSVPIDEFHLNLDEIVGHLKSFFRHIIVISPTPVDESRRLQYQLDHFGNNATGFLERTTDRAREYRNESAVVASKNNALFLDLWELMLQSTSWKSFLSDDGLHLSATGQNFVASQLQILLEKNDLSADHIPFDFLSCDRDTPKEGFDEFFQQYDDENASNRYGQGCHMPYIAMESNHMYKGSFSNRITTIGSLNSFFRSNPVVNVIGFGSLMSEKSARSTFPDLTNFRIVRVKGYRRVFRHPAAIFFERGIADLDSLRISSLSTEKCDGHSFIASVFSVASMSGENYLSREEEFDFEIVPFEVLSTGKAETGLMCVCGSDKNYVNRWGFECFQKKYLNRGLHGIWNYLPESGILPCSVYLRHCFLSAKKLTDTPEILYSFLDDTYLCDRKTTIRQYLESHPEILEVTPPESLADRYNG